MTRPGATARRADPLAVHSGPGARVVAAPAKLNLFLEIIAKRPDGYHDLESLMVAIDLFDTLEIQTRTDSTLALTCDPPSLSTGPDNLVYKAAVALRARAGRTQLGATIHLTKRVPMQAGLGGGSSDAAAALVGLNEIWKLGLTREELVAIAATIGSDVAFFLTPDMSAAWCTGRGEVVAPEEPPARGFHFVLVCPPVGLGTAGVYKRLTVPPEPNSGAALRAAFRAGDPAALGRELFNRLEGPALELEPLVGRVRHRLAACGPCGALMSGSGSAVFAVCRDRAHAVHVANEFARARPADEPESRVLVVRSFTP
ncbi:MAG: 4-(cytidine 5'-diphospho)-2-C-methyl-D-erythritol kinase [Planctomycetes bacterium]|nr:4-(cytidine 5'-diphospho)-2-C-methyl-D-erythritol kinase [Planctomycetota bacterium]